MSISQRFIEFLAEIGESDREAARKLDATHGWIGSIRRGGKMGTDKLERVLEAYPELNRRWLFEGIGSMIYNPKEAYRHSEVLRILKALRDTGAEPELLDELAGLIGQLEDERSEVQAELLSLMRKLQ